MESGALKLKYGTTDDSNSRETGTVAHHERTEGTDTPNPLTYVKLTHIIHFLCGGDDLAVQRMRGELTDHSPYLNLHNHD